MHWARRRSGGSASDGNEPKSPPRKGFGNCFALHRLAYDKHAYYNTPMNAIPGALKSARREFAFLLSDVARLLKTYTNKRAREIGATRAQWSVLARIERHQGLKQSELAGLLDIEPITLGRILDKLCEQGLVERRADADDRRVRRLFLLPAAGPILDRLHALGEGIMAEALDHVGDDAVMRLINDMSLIKENLKERLQCESKSAS
jgi:MarR family transcriptional regulator for hemolysin